MKRVNYKESIMTMKKSNENVEINQAICCRKILLGRVLQLWNEHIHMTIAIQYYSYTRIVYTVLLQRVYNGKWTPYVKLVRKQKKNEHSGISQ